MDSYSVNPIGTIHTGAGGFYIELDPEYRSGLTAIEDFSHINIIWWFSETDTPEARHMLQADKPYRKAPDVMGVFSTRSPIRPNPIALSCAGVVGIDPEQGRIYLTWIDADDGSPLLDIKPYTPSMDRVENPQVPDWCAHWPMSIESSGDFNWEDEFNF